MWRDNMLIAAIVLFTAGISLKIYSIYLERKYVKIAQELLNDI
jgi:Tfp pilus assembly major pilin PilA